MRGGGSEAYTLDAWRHAEQDLELRPLDDDAAWAIVETIFDEQSTPVPDRAETLQRIREIDPALRPLFRHARFGITRGAGRPCAAGTASGCFRMS